MAPAMEVIDVPPYVSDEEEDMNASVQVERKKQAKKKKHTWMKEMVFTNGDEAEQAVINEGKWSEYYTNTTAYGKKKVYRCNQVKRRGKQCDAGIYFCLIRITKKLSYSAIHLKILMILYNKNVQEYQMTRKWLSKNFMN